MSRRRKLKDVTPSPSSPPISKLKNAVIRRDSFINTITGLGDATRSKLMGMNQQYAGVLDVVFLEQLFKDSDLAWRIIASLPQEAMKDGFGLTTPAGDAEPEEVAQQAAEIMAECDRLDLSAKILEAAIWGRGYGFGAIVMGIVGAGAPDEPFDEMDSPTATLSWLLVTDRREMIPASYYQDPEGEKFGEVETYRISPANQVGATSWLVHETRIVKFPGVLTSRRERLRNHGCDYSVMQRVENVLEQTEMNWEAVCQLMADMSQGVFSVKGLIDMIASGNEQALLTRMILLDKTRSAGRAICLDTDSEKFERVQTPMAGVNDAIMRTWERLCAAAETPMFKLFGKSEAGLGDTGQTQLRVWYDQCQVEREQVLSSRILRIVKLISRNIGHAASEDWRVTWPSLWKMTAPEQSAMYLQIAQADKIYLDAGVVLAEEVALGRFANGDEFNAGKLQIDAAARKDALKAAIEELVNPTPLPVPVIVQGAQQKQLPGKKSAPPAAPVKNG